MRICRETKGRNRQSPRSDGREEMGHPLLLCQSRQPCHTGICASELSWQLIRRCLCVNGDADYSYHSVVQDAQQMSGDGLIVCKPGNQ